MFSLGKWKKNKPASSSAFIFSRWNIEVNIHTYIVIFISIYKYVSKSREKSYGTNTQTAPKQQKQQYFFLLCLGASLLVRRVVSIACPSIDPHWASMGSAAVPWAGMFEMEITAILNSIGCLKCPVLRPSIGTTPFGGLIILAITLAWVVLQVVLVDALGLASFLPLVLTLAFAFGISRRLQLLEEHPFVDLPGPEKLVFLDGLHCSLQSGAICHELVDLPPGISLRPQECELRTRWRAHRTNHTIHPSLTW